MLYIFSEFKAFDDIVDELIAIFHRNGIVASKTTKIYTPNHLDLYIIFGLNHWTEGTLPINYIAYQLEQSNVTSWFSKRYIDFLNGALEVWDYSLVNYQFLEKTLAHKNIYYVPIKYLTTARKASVSMPADDKCYDVYFYGELNSRRTNILDQLIARGLNVHIGNNEWGNVRLDNIKKSKIVLNIHYYDDAILETVRLSYLLSNGAKVLSERSRDKILDQWHSKFSTLVDYNDLVDKCVELKDMSFEVTDNNYSDHPYEIPVDRIRSVYSYLLHLPHDQLEGSVGSVGNGGDVSDDDFKVAETSIVDKCLVLKLNQINNSDLPPVSIVTITRNRRGYFAMPIRNWRLFDYPQDRLEWIIVDDSDNGDTLSDMLPSDKRIHYYKLQTTGPLSLGQKRNFGIERANYDFVCFMDDDDYYYPLSIRARIGTLLTYPDCQIVGVNKLDIYDTSTSTCAKVNSEQLSEASMGFRKSVWLERKFSEANSTLGEGVPFLKHRRHLVRTIPSCYDILAITHNNNYTKHLRKYNNVSDCHILDKILDPSSTQFIRIWAKKLNTTAF